MRGLILLAFLAVSLDASQLPAPPPDAPPVIDMALRIVRASAGGSSIARSASRANVPAYVYAGLDDCRIGAAQNDPAHDHSISWLATGRVRSVDRGIAVADVEWQRLNHNSGATVTGPRVQTTLTLPLGERVAVDFVEVAGSPCRLDGLIFEIGVAADHGTRLQMSGEGRSPLSGSMGAGRGGGGAGVARGPQTTAGRQVVEPANTAAIQVRPMPPRQYDVDVWLVPEVRDASPAEPLAHRMSQAVGGTGGRFVFPPSSLESSGNLVRVEISALVIPVGGDGLVVAITRHVTPDNGATPVSAGWIKAVPLPKPGDVLSFEIPAPGAAEPVFVPRHGYGLRLRIAPR